MSEPPHLDLSQHFSVDDVVRASRFQVRLALNPDTRARLREARAKVVSRVNQGSGPVYGFNTGFGDNRTRPTLPPEHRGTAQDNLILSHSCGYGPPLEVAVVRAAMAIRARTLAIGHSGVRPEVVSALCSLYNSGLVPLVPAFGSVGASGDLAPLSHVALTLMARGRVLIGDAEVDADAGLLAARGVERLSFSPSDESPGLEGPESVFGPKEGLALNNGTSFMAAWLALAVDEFDNLLWHANLALALGVEAQCGVLDAYAPEVQALRAHRGVQACSTAVREHLADSRLVFRRGEAGPLAHTTRSAQENGVEDSVQDDYSLRSGSVVHGTAWEALERARETVETEVNSVTDNPLVFEDAVLSGSHFHGMPLALAADHLRAAMAIVGGISERRVAKLMNDRRNYGLPRHLAADNGSGLKSGWMISQYLCAALVNELKTRSMPYCVGNVTTGNESEDYVSMGANACRAAHECAAHLGGVVAVELAATVRALLMRVGHLGDGSGERDLTSFSVPGLSSRAAATVRAFAGAGIEVWHTDDRPLEPIVRRTADLVAGQTLRQGA